MGNKRFFILECSKQDNNSVEHDNKHETGKSVEIPAKNKYDLPYEKSANELMSAKGYAEYVKKHGYHFTEKLAEHVSKMLYNNVPQLQYIPVNQISDLIESQKINVSKKATLGDIIYAANFAYSNLYPDLLKDMKSCVIHANKMVNSPNGYDGMIFCRWTADAIGKSIKIDWEKFI